MKMIKSAPSALVATFLVSAYLCPPSISASATIKLINDLEMNWNKNEMLDLFCEKGTEVNGGALSFFNPFIGAARVKTFSNNKEVMSSYMSKEEMQDEDTISAFADAMEAALLRAMRKRCPDVW